MPKTSKVVKPKKKVVKKVVNKKKKAKITTPLKPGKKNHQGEGGGHPPIFSSDKVLKAKIDEYFDYCDNRVKNIYSEKLGDMSVPNPEPYTMSGLAYWLEMDRQTLLNYSKTEKFFGTIKRAKARVEHDIERRMNDKETFTPGLIFNAKNNFKWIEKNETEHSGAVIWKEEEPK